jgi:hypothetical protein
MRKGVLLAALALALALVLAGVAIAASTGGQATGGVSRPTALGFEAHMSFNAKGTPADAQGQVETRVVDPATGDLVRQWHGKVDCYQPAAVGGDPTTARFSGFVTNSQGGEDVEGHYFRMTVRDNGEGANSPPDEIATERFLDKPVSACTAGTVPVFEEVHGNIQVKTK